MLSVDVKINKWQYEKETNNSDFDLRSKYSYEAIMSATSLYRFRLGKRDLNTVSGWNVR